MPFAAIAGIGGATSLLGGIFGSKSAKNAANVLQQGAVGAGNLVTNAANTVQQNIGGNVVAGQNLLSGANAAGQGQIAQGVAGAQQTLSPYVQTGSTVLPTIQALANQVGTNRFSFDPNNLANNPGYQFTLQQGQQAIQRAAASQGNLFSGGTLKSLANYTTGAANQFEGQMYNQALSTFQQNQQNALNQISTLQQLANQGLTASGQAANLGYQGGLAGANLGYQAGSGAANLGMQGALAGGQVGLEGASAAANYLTQAANAKAAGITGQTNAWLQGVQGIGNAIGGGLLGGYYGNSLGSMANINPNIGTGIAPGMVYNTTGGVQYPGY